MKRYRADVKIWGTAYVEANSEGEAREKILSMRGREVTLDEMDEDVDGRPYEQCDLSSPKLSPVATFADIQDYLEVEDMSEE